MPTTLEQNVEDFPETTAHGKAFGVLDGQGALFPTTGWSLGRLYGVKAVSGASYSLIASDEGKLVTQTHSAASTFTIPSEATLTWPVGGMLYVQRGGTGAMTVVAGSGATLTAAGRPKLRAQGSVAMLIKTGTNAWTLWGDTSA